MRFAMNLEAQRRLAVLGLLALASASIATIGAGASRAKVVSKPAVQPAAAAPIRIELVPPKPIRQVVRCPIPSNLRPAFEAAARDAKLPPSLLYAVAEIESHLEPNATSAAGARGLLQLMPTTGAMLDLDIDTPTSNVLAGARYLRQLLNEFGGSSDAALAAYNAGPTAVTKAGGAPTAAVLSYVANVNELWHSNAGCR
jgi:soluble lytic murein transglycosylase-like protein